MRFRPSAALLALFVLSACQAPTPTLVTPTASSSAAPRQALAPVLPATNRQAAAEPASEAAPATVPGEWIVELEAGVASRDWLTQADLAGFAAKKTLRLKSSTWVLMQAPVALDPAEALLRLRAARHVVTVSPHGRSRALDAAAEPLSDRQWARATTELDAVEGLVPLDDQANVIVAVVDSGLDVAHEEFVGRVVAPHNFVDDADETEVHDLTGHGTHVAGIIGADASNGLGIAGVAPGVRLMPLRVLDAYGDGDDMAILEALLTAIEYEPPVDSTARVRVINLSLGAPEGGISRAYAELYDMATERGIMIVAASGNDGKQRLMSPANTYGGLSVGATAEYFGFETLAPFSNRHRYLDLTAPGQGILSTVPRAIDPSGYMVNSGTSMATPFVAGVAALAVAKYDPDHARVDDDFWSLLYDHLIASVDDLGPPGHDPAYGYGRINVRKALSPDHL